MRSGSTPIARVALAAIARLRASCRSDHICLRLSGFARVIGLVAAAGLSASAESWAQFGQVSFDVRAPLPPTPFAAESRTHLVYELRITNTASSRRSIRQLDVLGPNASPLLSISGGELRRSAALVGSGRLADPTVLEPGRQALVMVWVTLPEAGPVPDRLSHRFIVSPPDSLDAERADTLEGPTLGTSGRRTAELSPPLVGGPWVAVNGPSNRSGHRITVLAVGGEDVDLRAAANYFGPGHRIRIEVSSSNFPRFDRNLKPGGINHDEKKWAVARNTLHHSARYRSHIVLPVIPARD
jgi:hypothetical protein